MSKVTKEKTKEYNENQKEYRRNFYKEYYKKNKEELKKNAIIRYDKTEYEKINSEIEELIKNNFSDEITEEERFNLDLLKKINILAANNKKNKILKLIKNEFNINNNLIK